MNNPQQAMVAGEEMNGTELIVISFVSNSNSEDSLKNCTPPERQPASPGNEECGGKYEVPERHSQHIVPQSHHAATEVPVQKIIRPKYMHVKAICIFLTVAAVVVVSAVSVPLVLFLLFGSVSTFLCLHVIYEY